MAEKKRVESIKFLSSAKEKQGSVSYPRAGLETISTSEQKKTLEKSNCQKPANGDGKSKVQRMTCTARVGKWMLCWPLERNVEGKQDQTGPVIGSGVPTKSCMPMMLSNAWCKLWEKEWIMGVEKNNANAGRGAH